MGSFPVTRGVPLCNGDWARWVPVERVYPLCSYRSRGVLFLPNRNDNGPGNAGGQVLPHGVTRRRIRRWGVWLGWYAGCSMVMQLPATSEPVRIWYWGAQSFGLASVTRI
ncbi:hypothetical protein F4677DRAFT_259551 [Hypoxylon crocopeplum]|nr:hypothetical protein F4677DRAFT_259551 [Hypoxylon crocopeplum]